MAENFALISGRKEPKLRGEKSAEMRKDFVCKC
jgi:hypothetical protein